MANFTNYTGPNVAGAPKNLIPNFLDHTINVKPVPGQGADSGPGSTNAPPKPVTRTKVSKLPYDTHSGW